MARYNQLLGRFCRIIINDCAMAYWIPKGQERTGEKLLPTFLLGLGGLTVAQRSRNAVKSRSHQCDTVFGTPALVSAHASGIVGRLVRQVLACVMAMPIAPTVPPPPVEPSPFRNAHDRYVAARDAFAPMQGETVPAWAEAEREFLAAAEAVDAIPVSGWAEFGDAFLCACDGGDSTLTAKAKHKLLADVRWLQAQDRTDLSGWGEPHMGWLATYQAARAIIDVARTEADEAVPKYQAAVARLHRAEDLLLTEPARSRPAVLARLYTAVKVSSEGSEIDTALTIAIAEEAEAVFGLGTRVLP